MPKPATLNLVPLPGCAASSPLNCASACSSARRPSRTPRALLRAISGLSDRVPDEARLQAPHCLGGSRARPNLDSFRQLREYFSEVDTDGSGGVSRDELHAHIEDLVERKVGPLGAEMSKVLAEAVRRSYAEVDLGLGGGLAEREWIHSILLHRSAPSAIAARCLNGRLRAALAGEPGLLARIHGAFEAHDANSDARLSPEQCREALQEVGVKTVGILDLNQTGFVDYFEFVGHAVGVWPVEVELAMYDLSNGYAKWIPSALLSGRRFEAVWHTGVRIFGNEYWYGGSIFQAKLGTKMPFGAPVRVITLGLTSRTQEELSDFIRSTLCFSYNRASYDVLTKNCNHFSNEVVQFLLNTKEIPEEVRMQPTWARDGRIMQILRPVLNSQLGSFAGGQGEAFIDDFTAEWRHRVRPGDLVLHRKRFIDRSEVACVTSTASRRGPTVSLLLFRPSPGAAAAGAGADASMHGRAFEMWDWAPARLRDVPLDELWPCLGEASLGATYLLAALAAEDRAVGRTLLRPSSRAEGPVCVRGHGLRPSRPLLPFQAPPCNICHKPLPRAGAAAQASVFCKHCSFYICGGCLASGQSLGGRGVFTNVLTKELAVELLWHPEWLRYKSQCFFHWADSFVKGFISFDEFVRVAERLGAVLELERFTKDELREEMKKRGEPGTQGRYVLGEAALEGFITSVLTRAAVVVL